MHRYPQRMINVEVVDRRSPTHADVLGCGGRRRGARSGSTGRVLVRASGTEPLVRVMVEAETEDLACEHAERIAEVVRSASS